VPDVVVDRRVGADVGELDEVGDERLGRDDEVQPLLPAVEALGGLEDDLQARAVDLGDLGEGRARGRSLRWGPRRAAPR